MNKNIKRLLSALIICLSITSCKNDIMPKPKAYLSLEYPNPHYINFKKACGYDFQYNSLSTIKDQGECNFHIDYPKLRATVYLNYRPVQNNIEILLRDAQKLTYEHVVKADNITEQPYINSEHKKFGMFYEVGGNAASQSQFYVTDSTKHFLMGSIYFYAKPNFDSVLPAAHYIKNDLKILMESLKWK
ncbi:gliding motility lipoprotein GldD [Flavobacterium columnare NBRC 100251 = ATCC 23463]|nr:gliding motility lipoprotein GldD [Flavobacterium columnare]APT22621.1 gliding motility lipoprotein GldD [Flavobacterium columnare]MEB3801080.1 gliding motility lipoprotein GldD [Flavobacterium columnare]OOB83180.1 gliding motility lipoprotein GldD [Flavobacterium columnare]PDS22154.1 gliding motility lipoprotein GldD [Flavobacterium columnare NBRC 100251 = ATCC 23463]QOG90152.1 gliding motility lipoprotein GldD [Flavobacterium columnare]